MPETQAKQEQEPIQKSGVNYLYVSALPDSPLATSLQQRGAKVIFFSEDRQKKGESVIQRVEVSKGVGKSSENVPVSNDEIRALIERIRCREPKGFTSGEGFTSTVAREPGSMIPLRMESANRGSSQDEQDFLAPVKAALKEWL